MVKNITIQSRGTAPSGGRPIINGHIHCYGGAYAKAKAGQDHYRRPSGQAWLIEAVIEGAGYVEGPQGTHRLEAGDVYALGPYAEFQYYPDQKDPWGKLFIELSGPLIEEIMRSYEIKDRYIYPQAHVQQQLEQLIKLLSHSGEHIQRDFPIAIHRLINSLYFKGRQIAPNMADYIEAHIHSEFTLEKMADHFQLSKNQVLRRFKKEYNKSPYEYLLQRRVDQAIWTLQHTSISVKDLAKSLQFSDNKHLSSTLKRRTGKSPSEHRS